MDRRSAEVHPEAIAEARAAYRWYAEQNPSAAIAFMTELDHAISEIETSPERWPVHLHGTRKFLFRRFPYAVIYRITEKGPSGHRSQPRTPPSRVLEKPSILNSSCQGLFR